LAKLCGLSLASLAKPNISVCARPRKLSARLKGFASIQIPIKWSQCRNATSLFSKARRIQVQHASGPCPLPDKDRTMELGLVALGPRGCRINYMSLPVSVTPYTELQKKHGPGTSTNFGIEELPNNRGGTSHMAIPTPKGRSPRWRSNFPIFRMQSTR
jgi:hypothetical protein